MFGTFVGFLPRGDLDLMTMPQTMTTRSTPRAAGDSILHPRGGAYERRGITEALMALASSLVGHFRGGLGHVNVAHQHDHGAVIRIIHGRRRRDRQDDGADMESRGFPRPLAVALTSARIHPRQHDPSGLGLIIYAALAQASVGALFVASVVPGLLMAVALPLWSTSMSVRHGYGGSSCAVDAPRAAAALIRSTPALVPTRHRRRHPLTAYSPRRKSGAIAALYALVCGVLFYRAADRASLSQALREALSDTVAVTIIIAAVGALRLCARIEQVPQKSSRT